VATLQPATAEKVEEKWSQMNLSLRRGIQKWERSGQGDGEQLSSRRIVSK
jgi:hypothetical protein